MDLVLLLVVAIGAFVLWHFVPRRPKELPKPAPRYRNDPNVSVDQADWRRFAEAHCESPAELAFLQAMIESLNMRPHNGSLIADGIRLDFQVGEGRYRVDFLVNQWLVVEIDGAAYHSSPEARMRDAERDRFFEGLGYTVLRLPAKLVFERPASAVDQVKSAVVVGKREVPLELTDPVKSSGMARLSRTAALFAKNVEMAEKKSAIKRGLMKAEVAFAAEQSAWKAALEMARQRQDHDEYLANLGPDGRTLYQQCLADLRAASGVHETRELPSPFYEAFVRPDLTEDEWVNDNLRSGFDQISARRDEKFRSMREVIKGNPELKKYIEVALIDLGRPDIAERVI